MWRHYLLSCYRALLRHRLYAALNVFGLAVGIAAFLALSLYVRFETGFERWIPRASSIYVMHTVLRVIPGMPELATDHTMGALLEELKADYPGLVGTTLSSRDATIRQGAEVTPAKVQLVDANFFRVFDLPLAAGDKADLLRTPDEVLLSQRSAKRYFDGVDPVGHRLTIVFDGVPRDYRVTGVLRDAPAATDFNFDFLAPMTPQMIPDQQQWRNWGAVLLATYLRFDTSDAAAAFNTDLDRFTDRHAAASMGRSDAHKMVQIRALPLLDQHLSAPKDAAAVVTLGTVGLLILLLAGVNYVNLATSRAGLRAKEVALRKVMGAGRGALVVQFMTEAVGMSMLATLVGLALCELSLPAINTVGGLALKIAYAGDGSIVPVLLGVVLLLGLGAGAYPALVLTRFQPAAVLASARNPGGGRTGANVREALVMLQFTIAIAFIIGTGVILAQARYLHDGDLGFDRNRLILVGSFGDPELTAAQRSTLLNLWRGIPGVVAATAADSAPSTESMMNFGRYTRPGMKGDGPTLTFVQSAPDFARTYGLRLLAGRTLDPSHGLDSAPVIGGQPDQGPSSTRPTNVVINLNAVRAMGFASPRAAIGQTVLTEAGPGQRADRVVGVIENARFQSPHDPIQPIVYYLQPADLERPIAAVRYGPVDPRRLMDRLHASWGAVAPTTPFRAEGAEASLQAFYRTDDQRGRLFSIGAVLAVIIGCLGLFGLASSTTERRVREIGIRKTLGASTADILRLLLGQFLRPVLLANLIAWPVAWLLTRSWLGGFDQRIALTPVYFLGASALALAIALLTVLARALQVARASPALALRYE